MDMPLLFSESHKYLGVSKNSGTPKWTVKKRENPIRIDDLGVPLFLETPICLFTTYFSLFIDHRLQLESDKLK